MAYITPIHLQRGVATENGGGKPQAKRRHWEWKKELVSFFKIEVRMVGERFGEPSSSSV